MNDIIETKIDAKTIEGVLLGGDLSKLTSEQRLSYYNGICRDLGLNPLTKPFEFITLNGKLVLYARKDCTEQLRSNRCISLKIVSRETVNDVYIVTAQATLPNGRCDESIGAVNIAGIKGDALANCVMKSETKAKRRVTLSICGLGMLDESELETVSSGFTAQKPSVQMPQKKDEVKPVEAGIIDFDKKALDVMRKKIGDDEFTKIMADCEVWSVDEIKTKQKFDDISKKCWDLYVKLRKNNNTDKNNDRI